MGTMLKIGLTLPEGLVAAVQKFIASGQDVQDRECQWFFSTPDPERARKCAQAIDAHRDRRATGVFEQDDRYIVLPLGTMLCNGNTDPAMVRCPLFDPMEGYREILKRWQKS